MFRNLFNIISLITLGMMMVVTNLAAAEGSQEYKEKYYTALAASSCLGVYMPKESTEFNYLRSYGWKIAPQVAKDGKVESNFAIAHHYFPDDKKLVFLITFRGSASKGDWEINLKTKKVNYGGNSFAEMQEVAATPLSKELPAIHKGFNTYVNNVLKNSVLNDAGALRGVFQVVKERQDAYLIITGHSLGGAAATLLGERLLDMGMPKDKFKVITFGAPAIANDVFVQEYGERMDLLRVINPNDPVPGSLQTFFTGYKQFGSSLKYHLPYKVSSIQHAMALYFDQSVAEYNKQFDIEKAAGRIEATPEKKKVEGVPTVAIWFNADSTILKQAYGEAVRRFIVQEYQRMLPSYAVMSSNLNLNANRYRNLTEAAREVGADYYMICGVEAQTLQDQDYWYLNLTQSVFDKEGHLMNLSSFCKKVDKAMSSVQAAGEILQDGEKELKNVIPFIELQHKGEKRRF